MTPEQKRAKFESMTKDLNGCQKAQLTSLMAGSAVAGALKRGEITEAQATDILRASAFACHMLSTFATLETLINAATSRDAPPLEILLATFVMDSRAEVRPALDKLQNLLEMLIPTPKETASS